MEESKEIEIKELQNKVELKNLELSDLKLDTVLNNQELAESTADSRAYDNECIQWRIERLWRSRLIVCNVCWAIAVLILFGSITSEISKLREVSIKAHEESGSINPTVEAEDKEAFAEMIDSLPAEQKAAWDHFAAQLKKDKEATIRHIELEHKKEMDNYDGGKESAIK